MMISIQQYEKNVSIYEASEDLNLYQVRDSLLIPALIAIGYHPDSVDELFNINEEGESINA